MVHYMLTCWMGASVAKVLWPFWDSMLLHKGTFQPANLPEKFHWTWKIITQIYFKESDRLITDTIQSFSPPGWIKIPNYKIGLTGVGETFLMPKPKAPRSQNGVWFFYNMPLCAADLKNQAIPFEWDNRSRSVDLAYMFPNHCPAGETTLFGK